MYSYLDYFVQVRRFTVTIETANQVVCVLRSQAGLICLNKTKLRNNERKVRKKKKRLQKKRRRTNESGVRMKPNTCCLLNKTVAPNKIPSIDIVTETESAIRRARLPQRQAEALRTKVATTLKVSKPPANKGRCTVVLDREQYFFDHINQIDDNIKFTQEPSHDNMLFFLDTKTIVEEDGNLRTEVYRKPTHTDQYLAFDSHHPLEHKLAVIKTLFHRADNIVTSDQAKTDEHRHLRGALAKCGYQNWTFNKALRPSDQSKKTQKCKPLTNKNKANITIPYVQGVSEKLRRIFQNFNIATNFKPHSTLRQRLVHPKDRPHKGTKANVIYRLKCEEPNNTYIGETSRPLKVRYKEHCRPSANGYSSAIFHYLQHNQGHSFKLESTDILDRETRWWERVHVSFSLRKFPIKVRTLDLGLVGDKYSRLKPDLQDVTTASKALRMPVGPLCVLQLSVYFACRRAKHPTHRPGVLACSVTDSAAVARPTSQPLPTFVSEVHLCFTGASPPRGPGPLRPTPKLSLKTELANKSAGEKSLSEEYIIGVLTPKHPGPRDSKIVNFELLNRFFQQQANPDYVPGPRRRRPANRRPRAPRPRPVAAPTPAAPAARDPPRVDVPLTALGNPRGTPSSSVSGSARQGQTNNRDDQSHDGDATPSNPTQGHTSPCQHDRQAPRSSPPPGGPRPGSVVLSPSSGTPPEPVPAVPARGGPNRAVAVGTSESTARDHARAEQSNPAQTGGSAVPVPGGDEQSIPVLARGSAVPVPEGDDEPVPVRTRAPVPSPPLLLGTPTRCVRGHARAEQSNPARTGGSAVPVPGGNEQSIPVPARGSAVPVPGEDDEPVPVHTRGPAAPVPSLPLLLGTPTRCVRGHARAEQSNPARTGGSAVPVPGGNEQSIPVPARGSAVPVPGEDDDSVTASTREEVPDPSFTPRNTQSTIDVPSDNDSLATSRKNNRPSDLCKLAARPKKCEGHSDISMPGPDESARTSLSTSRSTKHTGDEPSDNDSLVLSQYSRPSDSCKPAVRIEKCEGFSDISMPAPGRSAPTPSSTPEPRLARPQRRRTRPRHLTDFVSAKVKPDDLVILVIQISRARVPRQKWNRRFPAVRPHSQGILLPTMVLKATPVGTADTDNLGVPSGCTNCCGRQIGDFPHVRLSRHKQSFPNLVGKCL
ncbi:hypothetical protein Bbelb_397970 [Branchiostoma belcheri]|nr:hypothetical protein Bbelb_397970 [Branchiostoma belcheri]